MLERDIVTAIKRYLASLGSDVFFWKEHGGPYGCAGIPDIICCYNGRSAPLRRSTAREALPVGWRMWRTQSA